MPVLILLLAAGWGSIAQPVAAGGGVKLPVPALVSDTVVIHSIAITGNKITRDRIILREIMFRPGDRISPGELETLMIGSRQNLLNTALFNFVWIESAEGPDGSIRITVDVIERWYIWPIPIIKLGDRNVNVWWETKDFSRLSYGFYVDWRNFRGRRENLVTRFQFGYDQLFDFHYTIPYVNKKQTIGLGIGAGFHGQHDAPYITRSNRQEFYTEEEGYARQDLFAFAQLHLRRDIYITHLLELRYTQHVFSDSMIRLNPSYSVEQQSRVDYLTLYYKFKSDHRNFAPYPLTGYYFDLEAYKYGLGFGSGDGPDHFSLLATFRKYWQLYPRIFYAFGINGKYTPGEAQPYFLTRGIGYDRDIVRSYEYYVVDGNSFGILKQNLKFALISQRNGEFRFIKTEKFSKFYYALYANLFLDMGYADLPGTAPNLGNTLQNELLVGFGAGVDFVTYYDIVLRLEYAVNRMWEHGFFIHFNAPI